MTAHKYRARPLEVEAVQWKGDNEDELLDFAGIFYDWVYAPEQEDTRVRVTPIILTLEGMMRLSVGDYVIKLSHGNLRVMGRDEFEKKYEEIEE